MNEIVIKRCPVCPTIRSQAEGIAKHLQEDLGITVQIEDGAKGELTVLDDGVAVVQRRGDDLPTTAEVEAALQSTGPAPV